MKNTLITKITGLIEEYEYESQIRADISSSISDYYEGKVEGLKEALVLINEFE